MRWNDTALASYMIMITDLIRCGHDYSFQSFIPHCQTSSETTREFTTLRCIEGDVQDGRRPEAEALSVQFHVTQECFQFIGRDGGGCGEFVIVAEAHGSLLSL